MDAIIKDIQSLNANILTAWLQNSSNIIFKITLIIVVAWVTYRIIKIFISRLIKEFVRRTYQIKDGRAIEKRTKTLSGVLLFTAKVIIFAMVVMMILSELNINIGPLLAGAGIAGLAIGFGAQSLVKDIISGLFIILEDQYRTGDVVKIGNFSGLVEDINLRRTVLRDLDGNVHFIPNGEVAISSNLSKNISRVNLNIQVAYEENLDHVIRVINQVGEELSADEKFKDFIIKSPKFLGVDNFADSGIELKILGETKPLKQWDVTRELRKRIKEAFDREHIEIPYPHRVSIQKQAK